MTRRYAQAGVTVVMLDKNQRALEKLYDQVVDAGDEEPVIHPADLATIGPDDVSTMLDGVLAELGGIDVLVHCAAHFDGLRPLEQFPPEQWLLHLQVNLNAAWLLSSQCLGLLRQSDHGQLVFMLENLERVAKPNWGAYGASKHALATLVGQLALEVGANGPTVLGINPGPFRSPLRSEAYMTEDPALLRSAESVADQVFELLQRDAVISSPLVDLQAS